MLAHSFGTVLKSTIYFFSVH